MDKIIEKLNMKKKWTIRRYKNHDDFLNGILPEKILDGKGNYLPGESIIHGNVLLNEGIAILQSLLIGGAGTDYGNANAFLGVGEDATAEAESQTGLLGATLTFKAMEATYPQISGQVTTWRSVFATGDANIDWNEFTVSNSNSDAGDNLNRKVSVQGTKVAGQTWTLDLEITFS